MVQFQRLLNSCTGGICTTIPPGHTTKFTNRRSTMSTSISSSSFEEFPEMQEISSKKKVIIEPTWLQEIFKQFRKNRKKINQLRKMEEKRIEEQKRRAIEAQAEAEARAQRQRLRRNLSSVNWVTLSSRQYPQFLPLLWEQCLDSSSNANPHGHE